MIDVHMVGAYMARKPDIWSKVDALHDDERLANDPGFTIYEYADRYGLSTSGAHGRLRILVRKGKLVMGKSSRDGRRVNVFRFPD